jgi:outer membrane protein TolC
VALERVQVAQMNAETLDLQFQVLQIENRYGTATNQDLLTAAVNAANGRTALASAKSAAQLAALKLLNAMGY